MTGPFDIIGDVHGCAEELRALLVQLGWQSQPLPTNNALWGNESWQHPEGRIAIFVGDLVDRGPRILTSLCIVRNMIASGVAHCVLGNHDEKLSRWLRGRKVQINHGLERSVAELQRLHRSERGLIATFLEELPLQLILDGGALVVAHAGLSEELHGRNSPAVRAFCLYGQTTGKTDKFGLPIRGDWATKYSGKALVVFGHTPVVEPLWKNNTVNIDTGVVFGGKLSALRYPEREIVSVPARKQYTVPARPLAAVEPEDASLQDL
ncbi:metallophosphoesterase [Bryobacter aggregatus]|uniref:metallophosphoesterase n=1 Tax=Bryobacter aggregatus TaxID=360054 RepID=UPI00068E7772|nr:metallophosphoesterase [Bryobacter aggregatus]